MIDVMLDIETLNTTHDAVIVQIAAVRFDKFTGKISDTLNTLVKPFSQVSLGRTIGVRCVSEFWSTQPPEVQGIVADAITKGVELEEALRKLSSFVGSAKGSVVWGNGVLFDNAIIRDAWKSCGLEGEPWGYRADMDMRTLMHLGRVFNVPNNPKFEGIKHNALDDCFHQIKKVHNVVDGVVRRRRGSNV